MSLTNPFDKLLMPKVERVYNLWIDIVTKRYSYYKQTKQNHK